MEQALKHDRQIKIIILSIVLVKVIGVVGVIVATIITNLLICHIIEPYVLYKNAFLISPKSYYLKNYSMIILFSLSLLFLDISLQNYDNNAMELLVNGCISVGIAASICGIVMLFNINLSKRLIETVKKRIKK